MLVAFIQPDVSLVVNIKESADAMTLQSRADSTDTRVLRLYKFGDGGADILPLYRLNKRQGNNSWKNLVQTQLFEKSQQQT